MEARAEHCLGDRKVVVEQGLGGGDQLGVVDRGGDGVELGLLGRLVVAAPAKRRAEQPPGVGIAGRHGEDLARLLGGEARIVAQQPLSVPQRSATLACPSIARSYAASFRAVV